MLRDGMARVVVDPPADGILSDGTKRGGWWSDLDDGRLLIFAEGTRFTEQKHKNQASPYQHLLVPIVELSLDE